MKREWMNPKVTVLGVQETREDGIEPEFIKWCPQCHKLVSWCHQHPTDVPSKS